MATPDLFGAGCTSASDFYHNLGVNTWGYQPPVNAHNPSSSNQHVVGMVCSSPSSNGGWSEYLKNYLSSPLIPNNVYVLNCWMYNVTNTAGNNPVNTGSNTIVFKFASDQNYGSNYTGIMFPGSSLNTIVTLTTAAVNGSIQVNKWIPYSTTFTFNGSQNHNVVYCGTDALATYSAAFSNNNFVFLDDVSILPASQSPTITVPSTVACTASSFTDLSQYALPTGGVFSGPGVVFSGGKYSFNAAQTLTPGVYGITYSFTNALGCNQNYSFPISILPYTGTVSFAMPSQVCQSTLNIANMATLVTPTTLGASGIFLGGGVTQTITSPLYSLNGSSLSLGLHTYTYSYAGCGINLTSTTNILPPLNVSIINSSGSTCLFPNQSATLSTTSNSTGLTYNWAPPVSSNSSLVITPSVTTIYTVMAQTGPCITTQTINVTVVNLSVGNPITAICTNSTNNQSTSLDNVLGAGSPTAGVWSVSTAQGSVGVAIGTSTTSSWVYAQPGVLPSTYTLTYTYNAPSGCSISVSFPFKVLMTPTLTTNGPLSLCTNIPGQNSATLTTTSTSSLTQTYTWSPGGITGQSVIVTPTASTIYTVVASDGTCTSAPALQEVVGNSLCCGATGTSTTAWHYINTASIGSTTLNGLYAINQNLTITGTVSLYGEYYFAPNVSIIVNGGYLNTDAVVSTPDGTVISKAHLRSCNSMWNGIQVTNWGHVKFDNQDLIEDAKVAVSSASSINVYSSSGFYEIELDKVVFNRNRIAVAIKNYTQTAANSPPFNITSCIFTNRTFTYVPLTTALMPTWPMYSSFSVVTTPTNPLASPYLMAAFTPTTLKAPYATDPAYAGVYVENSGITSNPTTTNTSYTSILIGDGTSTTAAPNIFDNLYSGINTLNSNIRSFTNVFQNSRINSVAPNTYYGVGIKAINDNTNILNYNSLVNLEASVNPSVNINRFYDCHTGLELKNIFQVNVKYAEIRSTQSKLTATLLTPGQYGIWIQSNRFKDYSIYRNKILNVTTGVMFQVNSGLYKVTSAFGTGQVWGSVNIGNNLFSSAATLGGSPGNGFMNCGVFAINGLYTKGVTVGAGFYTIAPNNGFWIQNNTFDQVYRGVLVQNFSNSAFGKFTANNTFTITQDYQTLNGMWGVRYENNYNGVINSNTVTGFTTAQSTTLSGVYSSMNTNSKVECNTVYNLPKGIEFASNNSGMLWKANTMQTNLRGMQLTSGGVIGLQGSATVPSDNFWPGTWTGSNFNTWTDQSSYAVNSKIFRRTANGPAYNPPHNDGVTTPNSYATVSNFSVGSSSSWSLCTPVVSPTKGPSPPKSLLSKAVATNTLPYVGSYPSETSEINSILLFQDLVEDSALLYSDPILQTFYTVNQSGQIGKLVRIGQLISEGNYATATSSLSSFNDSTTIQTNYKLFYNLYLKIATNPDVGLNSTEKNNLSTLAHKCPFIDGPVVYYARALNIAVTGTLEVYNDATCDNSGIGNLVYDGGEEMRKINSDPTKVGADSFQLFPNPATDRIYVLGEVEKEELGLEIRDVTNKLILQTNLQITNYQSGLKLDFVNGVYFVTLIKANHESITKKLVIAK